jgi:hypothetical protein
VVFGGIEPVKAWRRRGAAAASPPTIAAISVPRRSSAREAPFH